MRRRHLFGLVALATPALAQEARPLRLVVPFVAGASSDTLARLVAPKLSAVLGQPVVVENRAGGGGQVAAQLVAAAPPDGLTLLFAAEVALVQAVLQRDPGYDPLRDFTAIVNFVENPALLCVRPAAPWESVAALLAAAKARGRGGLSYGSGGVGTPAHMAGAAMLKLAGAEGTHVPYRGANQAALAVEQGEVDFAFAISNIALPRFQQGAVRLLATTGERRIATLPAMPTLAESVPEGPVITSATTIAGPAGLAPAVTARLHAAGARIIAEDPAFRASLTTQGGEIAVAASPAEHAAQWAQAFGRWQRLVQLSGARAE
jgi:tripartite-type tricarboxylate transporter receptor subunit TctC